MRLYQIIRNRYNSLLQLFRGIYLLRDGGSRWHVGAYRDETEHLRRSSGLHV